MYVRTYIHTYTHNPEGIIKKITHNQRAHTQVHTYLSVNTFDFLSLAHVN